MEYLLGKAKANTCNVQEREELGEWYRKLDLDQGELTSWINEVGGEAQLTNTLFTGFNKRLAQNKQSNLKRYAWKMAAAAVLLVCGVLLFKQYQPRNESLSIATILPGDDKALLTLADGTTVVLDGKKKDQIAVQGTLLISMSETGELKYSGTPDRKFGNGKVAHNTVSVPRGGQYRLSLPDGSKIWLNSESSVRFPVTGNQTDRKVWLKGEGYFEIAHHKKLPFRVLSGDQQVQVFGTHFNVRAYADDPQIITTLLQGSVGISNYKTSLVKKLVPGEQATFNKHTHKIEIASINTDQAVAWKNGYFLFDNQDIGTVMKTVSRWYNVEVVYENAYGNERFGGTFSRNANLNEILNNLQELGNVRFKITQRKIIVSGGR